LVRVYVIETSKQDVPEGISIDSESRVWVCTDGMGMLHQIELEP
jgi:secreted PhoX family phosphatase